MTTADLPAVAAANLPAPDQDAQTLNLAHEAKLLVRDINDLQVADDDSDARAANALVTARRVYSGLEERRTALKAPALEYGRKVDAHFKAIAEPLQAAADKLKIRSRDYKLRIAREAEERQREAAKRAEEAQAEADRLAREQAAAATATAAPGAPPVAEVDPFDVLEAQAAADAAAAIAAQPMAAPVTKHHVAGGGSAGLKKVAKWEVADIATVPREFLILDEKRINAIVRAAGLRAPDEVKIPGIRVFLEDELAVRR